MEIGCYYLNELIEVQKIIDAMLLKLDVIEEAKDKDIDATSESEGASD